MSRRWVLITTNDDSLGDVQVFGPWRSKAKALAAQERFYKAVGEGWSLYALVVEVDPEHGSFPSLTALLRRHRQDRARMERAS